MKRFLLVALILLAVIAVAVVYLVRGRPAPNAAAILPESTVLFLDAPDFPRSRTKFQNTTLSALWQEPEVQAFLQEPRRALSELLGVKDSQDNGKVAESILDAIQGEAFAAVTRVSVIPSFRAGVVIGVDTKSQHLKARATLAFYEQELKKRSDTKVESKKHLGVGYSIWNLRTTWKLLPQLTVCHTFLNTMLVVTLGEDEMRDVIARFSGQRPRDVPSLAANDRYQNVLRHLPPAHEFASYVNVQQVANLVGPFLAFMPQTASSYQQLLKIHATTSSFTFVDKQIQDVGFTAFGTDVPPRPVTQRKTLALTSSQTTAYAVQSTDFGTAYREMMDSIAQSGNQSLVSPAAQFDQQMRTNNVRVREDLLSNLGPETALVLTWREGAPYPDAALVAEIRNAAQTRPRIDLAMKALKEAALGNNEKFPLEEMDHLGEMLHIARMGPVPVAPTYVTTDSFFILASTPDYARELVGQLKQPKPTLAANTKYQQIMQQLPDNACSYSYCDLEAVFRPLYSQLRSSVSSNDTLSFVDLGKLPQADTIARHLSPFASATVTEPRNETTTSFSPLGKPVTLLITTAGALAIAQPYLEPYLAPYLSLVNPAGPTGSSGTRAPPRPPGNQTAESRTPPTQ